MARSPAHESDQDAPCASRDRTRANEDFHRTVSFLAEDSAYRRAPAGLEKQPRYYGTHNGRDALEDGGATQRKTGMLWSAPRAVEGGIKPG